MKRWLLAILLIGSALGYSWWAKRNLETQLSALPQDSLLSTLPAASFVTLAGVSTTTDSLSKLGQRALLVHFWATWCGPCEAELPELLQFVERLPLDVALALVAVNDEVPKIQKFINQLPATSQKKIVWLLDNQLVHREQFGTTKLPESYLFRADGKLLRKFVGPQEWEKPHFIDIFQSLLP